MGLSTLNWKTTGFAIAYFACYFLGKFVPAAETMCEVIANLIVTGGLVSAADAGRVANIVKTVDNISWRMGVDPATLVPAGTPPAPKV